MDLKIKIAEWMPPGHALLVDDKGVIVGLMTFETKEGKQWEYPIGYFRQRIEEENAKVSVIHGVYWDGRYDTMGNTTFCGVAERGYKYTTDKRDVTCRECRTISQQAEKWLPGWGSK